MSAPATAADRNLLFGILAVQMNFISRDALIAAMNAWVLDKHKPLGQILLDQNALAADTHQLLDALVQKHLDMHGGDAEKSLAAVSSVGSMRNELRQIDDADVQASLACVARDKAAEVDSFATRATSVGQATSAGVRFRILRPHAKGGLGEVFVAEDAELHREVALKEIQDRHADSPSSRARFVVEAEITGGLEHPGIVPVYGLGQYADGRPFYAMRFIRGDSLKEAIERFHKGEGSTRDPGERAVEFRKLLGRLIDVCNAVAYAHSRGVLHRDLKPGNIMLGKYGETLVVDWGLAKPLDLKQANAAPEEPPLRPSGLSGTVATVAGSAVGTPQFMSPEQAAGRLDQLGPASDVYSLGATLYCLLTGRPPITDTDVADVLRKAERGDFPPPRQIKADVPRALDAICLKAMKLKPADRYASLHELTDDLEHWLADESVAAYAEPCTVQLGRWLRRHRAFVGTCAAAVAVVGTALIAGVLLAAAAEREGQARTRADEQQLAAEAMDRLRILARRYQYLADVNAAGRAWQEGNVRSVQSMLDRYAAPPAREDARGFEYHYLRRFVSNNQLRLAGHSTAVLGVAFSPNGTSLASAGADGTVRLWHAGNGAAGDILKEHPISVHCVAFSTDGRWLASGDAIGQVCVRDCSAGKCTLRLLHERAVIDLAFGPAGRVASASDDKTVKLWDVATQDAPMVLLHEDEVLTVGFSPDGKWLVSGDMGGDLHVWDASNGTKAQSLYPRHRDAVSSAAFSADGKWLISGSWDQTIKVWDTATWNEVYSLEGHRGPVNAIALSPDGCQMASAGWDQTVRLWDLPKRQLVSTYRGHTDRVDSVAFDADGCRMASAGADGTVRIWDITTDQEAVLFREHKTEVSAVAFSPDGRRVASLGRDGAVKLWDANTGEEAAPRVGGTPSSLFGYESGPTVSRPERPLRLKSSLRAVAFSPEGDRIVAICDKALMLWDGHTGQRLASAAQIEFDRANTPLCMAGGRLVTVQHGRPVQVSPPSDDTLPPPRLDPAPDLLVTDLLTGMVVHRFHDKRSPLTITGGTVRADGRWLALGREDGSIDVWNTLNGDVHFVCRGHDRSVTGLAFHADGALASVSLDGVVKVWSGSSGRELATMQGHADSVNALAFSPDGRRLATASADRTVKIWDVATGQEVLTLTGHGAGVEAVAFDADGRHIASAGADRVVRVWSAEEQSPAERRQAEARSRPGWHRRQALTAEARGYLSAATFHLDRLMVLQPGDGALHRWRGFVRARLGQLAGAAADFSKAVSLNPEDSLALNAHARTCLDQGNSDGYRSACAALVVLPKEDAYSYTSWVTLRACLLAPDAVADFKPLIKHVESLMKDRKDLHLQELHGGLLLRAGRPQEAVKYLKEAIEARTDNDESVHAHFLLALAYRQLKKPAEARLWFDKGTAWMEKRSSGKERWGRLIWLELDLLRRETAAALEGGK